MDDMNAKEVIDRATKALYAYENSKPNEVTAYDAMYKANEALRLVRDLASSIDNGGRVIANPANTGGSHANK